MNYYIHLNYTDGEHKKKFLGIPYGQTKPTIDLISIALVVEDGREYYAISKDFNLKEAWNRYEIKTMTNLKGDSDTNKMKVYWIRENVLKPIWEDLCFEEFKKSKQNVLDVTHPIAKEFFIKFCIRYSYYFNYKDMKNLINKYGKTNKQIAEEVKEFCYEPYGVPNSNNHVFEESELRTNPIQFYGYFADYDWVCFAWLFGKMNDLPKGFPKYCTDLRQELDRCQKNLDNLKKNGIEWKTIKGIDSLKKYPNYPKQTNEHNALADARWNKQLHEFIKSL